MRIPNDSPEDIIAQLRSELAEAKNTIDAIRRGEVDAFVIDEGGCQRVYTLEGADRPYRLLVEQMQQGAVTLTTDGAIAFCNSRFAEMVNVPHHQLIGEPLSDFICIDGPQPYSTLLADGFKSTAQSEAHVMPRDGAPFPAFLTFNHVDRDSEVAVGVLITDLSSQRALERLHESTQQLQANEERYRTLFNSIDEGFCVVDLIDDEFGNCIDYRFVEINPAFEKQSGISSAIGKKMSEVVAETEPFWFELYGRVATTGIAERVVSEHRGLQRWYSTYAFRLGEPGSRRVAILFNDITQQHLRAAELKSARSRLQSTLGAAEVGTWEFDLVENRVYADINLARMFGVSKQDADGGPLEAYLAKIHPDDRARVGREIAAAIESGETLEADYRIAIPGHDVRYVVIRGRIHRNAHGQAIRAPGVVMDITERRIAEEALKRSERLANQANRAKSEFVANMSHEIRTPMTAILGYADLLDEQVNDEEARNYLSTIRRNGDYLLEIINDILDLSKIEADRLELIVEAFDPHALIEDVRSIMAVRAGEQGLDFEIEYATPIPELIQSDAKRFKQILINLVGNAVKFTMQGRVEITVGYRQRQDSQHGELVVEVSDTGIGMTTEQQERLFQPFTQGGSLVTQQFGGTGLGLAISQRLASLLGGEILCQSEYGVGTTFTATIATGEVQASNFIDHQQSTAAVDEISPHDLSEQVSSEQPSSSPAHLDCQVLVVDDRRDIRYLTKRILTKIGSHVVEAEDGLVALQKIKAAMASGQHFGMIILDMQMPNLDGYQTAVELRKLGVEAPIIALTADAMQGDMNRCIQAGCNAYLSKPIDAVKLVELVTGLAAAQ